MRMLRYVRWIRPTNSSGLSTGFFRRTFSSSFSLRAAKAMRTAFVSNTLVFWPDLSDQVVVPRQWDFIR